MVTVKCVWGIKGMFLACDSVDPLFSVSEHLLCSSLTVLAAPYSFTPVIWSNSLCCFGSIGFVDCLWIAAHLNTQLWKFLYFSLELAKKHTKAPETAFLLINLLFLSPQEYCIFKCYIIHFCIYYFLCPGVAITGSFQVFDYSTVIQLNISWKTN